MDYKTVIQNSIDYIEDNLCEKLSISDLAKQSYLSEFYFHKIFHKTVGEPIMRYVKKRRFAEAALELVKTNKKITDIAFKYDFNSAESFSRAFKKIYGTSPRDYRNSNVETSIIHYGRAKVINASIKPYKSPNNTLRMVA